MKLIYNHIKRNGNFTGYKKFNDMSCYYYMSETGINIDNDDGCGCTIPEKCYIATTESVYSQEYIHINYYAEMRKIQISKSNYVYYTPYKCLVRIKN